MNKPTFEGLGSAIVKRRKRTLVFFILATLAFGAIGSGIFANMKSGGYSDTNSESWKAGEYLTNTLNEKEPAVTFVVHSEKGVTDPIVAQEALALENEVKNYSDVTKTISYWSLGGAPQLASKDGKSAYIFIYSKQKISSDAVDLSKQLQAKYDGNYKDLRVYVGGFATFSYAINHKISKDLALAESISIPLTFITLAFIFGGLVASAMPLVVAVSAILGAFLILFLISLFTDVSIFALNLTTGLGMGLGIDYSLLIVNRFREELHKGNSVNDSVVTTVKTAGRTVFFSGLTVLVTLSSLIFFPQMFLKSFGYAGVGVVAMAVAGALIPLPAILALLGNKIDKLVVHRAALTPKEDGRWAKLARFVMRRPLPVVLASVVLLGILAAPLKNITFAQVDSRVMPASDKVAIASQFVTDNFPGQAANPIEIIIPNGVIKEGEVNSFISEVSKVSGVISVGKPEVHGQDIRVSAIHSMGTRTPEVEKVIHTIRDLTKPSGTLVGGVAADYTDSQDGIVRVLPFALAWIALFVLLFLFVFTGSIILPIKAVILNVLSLGATLGALNWVFASGHLKWLVGDFIATNSIDTSMVILIAVVAFGLSMDYELFLLSRIREEHEAGKKNIDAVAVGLQRSARIITAAAVLLAIVFAVFVTSGVSSIKQMGFGVAFAIILDATIVRALLVPALMRLFGELNWWAPKFLKRFTVSH
jgi:RND superfamily putative drug exporter